MNLTKKGIFLWFHKKKYSGFSVISFCETTERHLTLLFQNVFHSTHLYKNKVAKKLTNVFLFIFGGSFLFYEKSK